MKMRRRFEAWGATFRDLQLHYRSLIETGALGTTSFTDTSPSQGSACSSVIARDGNTAPAVVHGNVGASSPTVSPVQASQERNMEASTRDGSRVQSYELIPSPSSDNDVECGGLQNSELVPSPSISNDVEPGRVQCSVKSPSTTNGLEGGRVQSSVKSPSTNDDLEGGRVQSSVKSPSNNLEGVKSPSANNGMDQGPQLEPSVDNVEVLVERFKDAMLIEGNGVAKVFRDESPSGQPETDIVVHFEAEKFSTEEIVVHSVLAAQEKMMRMKQCNQKTNVERVVATDQPTVKRKRGRPRKIRPSVDETPSKEELQEKPKDVPPPSKRKLADVEKPEELMTEEEKEERIWQRLEKLEANATKKKRKQKVKDEDDTDSEAHFVLPVNLDELDAQESSDLIVDEPDDLRQIWRDADFAIRNNVDNLMEQAKRRTAMQVEECDCDHDFFFGEDIGRVCSYCGFVDKLVTDHFELPRSFKRPRTTNNKKVRLEDECTSRLNIECKEDTFDEVEEFNPSEFHLKSMEDYQKQGFRFLVNNLFGKNAGGAFLHHAPGTGKTFLVISFLQTYFYKFPERRALIAVPKNVLENWVREFKKWQVDPIPVKILSGEDKLNIVSNWYAGTGVLLVSPHTLARLIDERREDPSIQEIREMLILGPHLLVLDEAHIARNRTAKIFGSLDNIQTRQRIFLSGTAFQNNLDEVFHLLRLCRPDFIHWSPEYALTPDKGHRQFFKEAVQDRLAGDRVGAIRAFRSLTEPFVQWYGGKVLEKRNGLEDFIVILKLSDDHMMRVKQRAGVQGGKNFIAEDHYLAQACVHPCLAEERFLKENQDPFAGVKTAFILELLRYVGNSERVIIFCQFKKPLSLLKQLLKDEFKWSEDEEILHIDGHTPQSERTIITDVFNSPTTKARVLLASLKTCGEGISLIGGSRVVILDIAWNPSVVRQAVSRAFRKGQLKKVYVYRLLATDTDEVDKLKSCMDKEFLGRALFDTGFNIEGRFEITPASDLSDKFLIRFLEKHTGSCTGIYVTPK